MITINYRESRPIYEQVRDGLRQLVVSGAIPPGDKLPSVREMAGTLAINPNTIQRAYRELESEGYIVSLPGKGSFACECSREKQERQEALLRQLDTVAAELKWLGVSEDELCARIKGGNKRAEN